MYCQLRVLRWLLGSKVFFFGCKKKSINICTDHCGQVSVTETVDLGLIPCLAFSNKNGQCQDSTVCGRQVGKWQLNLKTKRFFCCLLAKATWWIKQITKIKGHWWALKDGFKGPVLSRLNSFKPEPTRWKDVVAIFFLVYYILFSAFNCFLLLCSNVTFRFGQTFEPLSYLSQSRISSSI